MPTNKRNDEVKEFAIGTKIEYNGKLYEVVEELFCDNCSIANICTNAEFTNIKKSDNLLSREQRYSIFGKCSNYNRADGASVVFKEVPKDDSKYEYYKISPLWVYNNPAQLRPIELVLPNGYMIDKDHSDLDKGVIRFKSKWLSLEQLYKIAKESHYITNRSAIKEFSDGKLVALANLMDIARYFNGDWNYNANSNECGYMIAYDKTRTTDDSYQIVHINSDTDMYFGNIMFKNEADAQYVIDNPNFRDILDNIFKV